MQIETVFTQIGVTRCCAPLRKGAVFEPEIVYFVLEESKQVEGSLIDFLKAVKIIPCLG